MKRSEVTRIYDAYAEGIFRFLLSLVRSEADARDLLQDVFVRIARNDGFLDGVAEEEAFLFRVARNVAIDHSRRATARNRKHDRFYQLSDLCSGLFASGADPDVAQFRESLASSLAELPEEQRSVVYLKLWEGETFKSIAEICGISANTAASRYRYGVDKIRELLRPLYDEIND